MRHWMKTGLLLLALLLIVGVSSGMHWWK